MPPTKPYRSALCEAIRNSNVLIVKLLLEHGAEVNPVIMGPFCNPTPLQEAVLLSNPGQILKLLLTHGANVDPASPQGFSPEQFPPPLIQAVVSGNTWTVQTLLKAGAYIDRWSSEHGNALQAAVASNNLKMLQILVHEKADVNAPSHLYMDFLGNHFLLFMKNRRPWTRPTTSAALNGNLAMIKVLLKAGADFNCCVSQKDMPYLFNVFPEKSHHERREVWENFRQITNTPLQAAVQQENIEIVQFLLEAGASVDMVQNGNSLLQIAARCNNLELIELLLSHKAQICTLAVWPFQRTPVQAAAEKGNQAILRVLLEAMPDILGFLSINQSPSPIGGRTALQGAAANGHVEMVEFLLALGADVHGPVAEQQGVTILEAAARSRDITVAHLIIAAGAATNVPYDTTSALATAIRNNDLPMFNLLSQCALDVNSWTAEKMSLPLGSAARSKSTFFLQSLISRGASVNARCFHNGKQVTPLEIAVECNHPDTVRLLLQAGVDVKACEGHGAGGEALLIAVQRQYFDIAKLLLESGVYVGPRTGISLQYSDTGAAAIAEAAFNTDTSMVTLLLQHGADPSAEALGNTNALANAVLGSVRGEPGEEVVRLLLDAGAQLKNYVKVPVQCDDVLPGSLLAVAAQSGSVQLVRLLLASGADPKWRYDLDNWTALQCAIASGSEDIVHVILEAGGDINAGPSTEDGRTALQAAASRGNLELVRLLLRKGADVNESPGKVRGVSALQAASISGHLAVVVQLLCAGADINGESSEKEGRTALQGAAELGRLDVVSLLLENDLKMDGFYDRCQDAATYARSERHSVVKRLLLNYRKD
ncbi:MAG: hypothetical protein Q9205_005799 [Flavoplaca limonia]